MWDEIDEKAAREPYVLLTSEWTAHDEHRERHTTPVAGCDYCDEAERCPYCDIRRSSPFKCGCDA